MWDKAGLHCTQLYSCCVGLPSYTWLCGASLGLPGPPTPFPFIPALPTAPSYLCCALGYMESWVLEQSRHLHHCRQPLTIHGNSLSTGPSTTATQQGGGKEGEKGLEGGQSLCAVCVHPVELYRKLGNAQFLFYQGGKKIG